MKHARKRLKKKHGRERTRAWIYGVINPLLEGLRIEATFLEKGNWTFRRYNRDLEFIRPIPILVGYKGQPNLEDFMGSNPKAKEEIDRRDAQREELRDACREAFDRLAANPEFQQKVSECFQAVEAETPGATSSLVHSAVLSHEVVAETVVNKGGVPDHAGFYPFWTRFKDEFMPFRDGAQFANADQAGNKLKTRNETLFLKLSQVRGALAEEYDIPWAPFYDEASALSSR
jgi:hypothetical protein